MNKKRNTVKYMDKRMIKFSPPDISEAEIQEVAEALRSGWITTGPRTKLLEKRLAAYIETGKNDIDVNEDSDRWSNRVVCLNSGTAAEELNLRVLGIGCGDEVIVPAFTYSATASSAIHCGATVKFVDIIRNGNSTNHSPEMDYDMLEALISEKTKAIIPVDIYGIPCDYEKIYNIINQKRHLFKPKESDGTFLGDLSSAIQKSIGRIAVISDCAHSLGAYVIQNGEKQYCGRMGDFSSFSFHAVKNFTTAEGGASTWKKISGVDDADIYKAFQLLSLHGQNKDALAKAKIGSWEYDIIAPYYKCNMTDIMAALGLCQLNRYPDLLSRRHKIIEKYDKMCYELGVFHLYHSSEHFYSNGHLYIVRIPGIDDEKRRDIITKFAQQGIATNVHYKPLPMMTAYKQLGNNIADFPNSYNYYENLITLPLHTLLTDEDVDYIINNFKMIISQYK